MHSPLRGLVASRESHAWSRGPLDCSRAARARLDASWGRSSRAMPGRTAQVTCRRGSRRATTPTMRSLAPCPSCSRHVRFGECTCPFCAASLNVTQLCGLAAKRARGQRQRSIRASRSAFRAPLLTLAALLAQTACEPNMVAIYGAPPPPRSDVDHVPNARHTAHDNWSEGPAQSSSVQATVPRAPNVSSAPSSSTLANPPIPPLNPAPKTSPAGDVREHDSRPLRRKRSPQADPGAACGCGGWDQGLCDCL